MDRSKTVELMMIIWRLGTGRTYPDYPKVNDLLTVQKMGAGIVPLLTDWTDDHCCIIRTGAAVALHSIIPAVRIMLPRPGTMREEIPTFVSLI